MELSPAPRADARDVAIASWIMQLSIAPYAPRARIVLDRTIKGHGAADDAP